MPKTPASFASLSVDFLETGDAEAGPKVRNMGCLDSPTRKDRHA